MAESVQTIPLTPIHPPGVPIAGIESALYQADFAPLPADDDAAPPPPAVAPPRALVAQREGEIARPEPRISAPTTAEMEEFAYRLRQTLREAGIAVTTPVDLYFRTTEVITAAHPHAATIEAALNGDSDLAATYRTLAARCDLHAQSRLATAFFLAWRAAATEKDRDAVRRRYAAFADQLAGASGRLRIGLEGVMSLALQFTSERGFG